MCAPPPRAVGTKDLSALERGIIDALHNQGQGYRKIARGISRGPRTVQRYLKNKTYSKIRPDGSRSSGKGRKKISTAAQDTLLNTTFVAQRKVNLGVKETTAGGAKAASAFPGSLRTTRRRLLPRKKHTPREKSTLTANDNTERHTWCVAQVTRPVTFWTEQVCFIDCKCFRIRLSQCQKAYERQRKVRFVIRTRSEGLLPECVKPGKGHNPGNAGTVKVFMAVCRGQVCAWLTFRVWNGRTYTRCLNALRAQLMLRGFLGGGARVVLCHDNDPSLKSRLGMRHAARLCFDPLPLPVRSPELMPHDFSIWRRILVLMQAHEDAPGYVRETVPAYELRLKNTAVGLPAAYVTSVQAKVHEIAGRIVAKQGGHINEGTKRVGDR